jgi:hypothetical protein
MIFALSPHKYTKDFVTDRQFVLVFIVSFIADKT